MLGEHSNYPGINHYFYSLLSAAFRFRYLLTYLKYICSGAMLYYQHTQVTSSEFDGHS